MKKEYVFEGSKIKNLEGFYDAVGTILIPGVEWGRNLDAFDDILFGGFGTPEEGFRLIWKDSNISEVNLGHNETARWLKEKQKVIDPSNKQDFQDRLEQVEKGEGQTLFHEIIEILRSHPAIELVLV
jgi:RNAse (barnase) inhibitor barstar